MLYDGPGPLNSTGRHGLFLNSTCDIRLSDMRHDGKKDSDMRHGYFLNSTCDMVENKGQRHATLAFLKIDMQHQDSPSRAPVWSIRQLSWVTSKLQCALCNLLVPFVVNYMETNVFSVLKGTRTI